MIRIVMLHVDLGIGSYFAASQEIAAVDEIDDPAAKRANNKT